MSNINQMKIQNTVYDIEAKAVNSGNAAQGTVLTADGAGGASFQAGGGGGALYMHTLVFETEDMMSKYYVGLINTSSVEFTYESFQAYMINKDLMPIFGYMLNGEQSPSLPKIPAYFDRVGNESVLFCSMPTGEIYPVTNLTLLFDNVTQL